MYFGASGNSQGLPETKKGGINGSDVNKGCDLGGGGALVAKCAGMYLHATITVWLLLLEHCLLTWVALTYNFLSHVPALPLGPGAPCNFANLMAALSSSPCVSSANPNLDQVELQAPRTYLVVV